MQGTRALVAFFKRHKRNGLAAATSALVMEARATGSVKRRSILGAAQGPGCVNRQLLLLPRMPARS